MKKVIIYLSVFTLTPCFGKEEIVCATERKTYQVILKKNSLKIRSPHLKNFRSTSSEVHARTKWQRKGFSRILFLEGKKFTIHIGDQDHFSEINDYLSIRTLRGHEMTYPIYCHRQN